MANSEAERRLELAPTFGEILRSCQADTRSILRNIENVSYKLNNAITAVDFNTSCIYIYMLRKMWIIAKCVH